MRVIQCEVRYIFCISHDGLYFPSDASLFDIFHVKGWIKHILRLLSHSLWDHFSLSGYNAPSGHRGTATPSRYKFIRWLIKLFRLRRSIVHMKYLKNFFFADKAAFTTHPAEDIQQLIALATDLSSVSRKYRLWSKTWISHPGSEFLIMISNLFMNLCTLVQRSPSLHWAKQL